MYSEKKRSVLAASAGCNLAPASAIRTSETSAANRSDRVERTVWLPPAADGPRKTATAHPTTARRTTGSRQPPRYSVRAVQRYHVTTFGCQMNAHDSERIKGMLEELGLGEAHEQA